jgi:hypothetical protein
MSELSRTGDRCCFSTGADPGTNPNYDEKKRRRQRLKRIEADAGRSTPGREKENRGRTKPAHWAKNNNVEHFRSELEMKSKGEQQQHTRDEKFGYYIKIQHDYTESEEVTALPPSFDYQN